MSNLGRATSIRSDANKSAKTKKAAAAVSRTGQVARSSISVRDDEVMLDSLLAGTVDTAEVTVEHSGDLGLLDDAAVTDFDAILDAGGAADVDDMIDAADAIPDMGEEFGAEAELAEQNHVAHMRAIEAAAEVTKALEEVAAAIDQAANAVTTANGKNARRRGVTEPDPPEGGWAQGDQWIRDVEQPGGGVKAVEALVWNGTEFVPEQILATELLVLGENGDVRIGDGKVTAQSMAVDALNFMTATGLELVGAKLVGGEILLSDVNPSNVIFQSAAETTTGWGPWVGSTTVSLSSEHKSGSHSVTGPAQHGVIYRNSLSLAAGNLVEMWVRVSVTQAVSVMIGDANGSIARVTAGTVQANTWTLIRVDVPNVGLRAVGAIGEVDDSQLFVDDLKFIGAVPIETSYIRLGRDVDNIAMLTSVAGPVKAVLQGGTLTSSDINGNNTKVSPTGVVAANGNSITAVDATGVTLKAVTTQPGGESVTSTFGWVGRETTNGVSKLQLVGLSGVVIATDPGASVALNSNLTVSGDLAVRGKTTQPGNVFALKSQLDAWAAIDGTHAWVTSEGREYVRSGGSWQLPGGDTDWIDLPYAPGFEAGTAQQAQIRVKDGVAYYRGGAQVITGDFTAAERVIIPIGGIPADARPSQVVRAAAQATGGRAATLMIHTNGGVYVRADPASTPPTWISGVLSYPL